MEGILKYRAVFTQVVVMNNGTENELNEENVVFERCCIQLTRCELP
jgi:hypothetical protein